MRVAIFFLWKVLCPGVKWLTVDKPWRQEDHVGSSLTRERKSEPAVLELSEFKV